MAAPTLHLLHTPPYKKYPASHLVAVTAQEAALVAQVLQALPYKKNPYKQVKAPNGLQVAAPVPQAIHFPANN